MRRIHTGNRKRRKTYFKLPYSSYAMKGIVTDVSAHSLTAQMKFTDNQEYQFPFTFQKYRTTFPSGLLSVGDKVLLKMYPRGYSKAIKLSK